MDEHDSNNNVKYLYPFTSEIFEEESVLNIEISKIISKKTSKRKKEYLLNALLTQYNNPHSQSHIKYYLNAINRSRLRIVKGIICIILSSAFLLFVLHQLLYNWSIR